MTLQNPLILLAPSKTLNLTDPAPSYVRPADPLFLESAANIHTRLQKLSVKQIATLMHVSTPIAQQVHDWLQTWQGQGGKPALWTYRGDVYKGFKAQELSSADAAWAEKHVVVLSGLYGLLRPSDAIEPYRLEMKTTLKVGKAKNLYELWQPQLAAYVDGSEHDWICNLSSDEYARAALGKLQSSKPVVTPVFFDKKPNGVVATVPIYSKMMRGVLARWMIDNKASCPQDLVQFSAQQYVYDVKRSTNDKPAFYRDKMVPLKF